MSLCSVGQLELKRRHCETDLINKIKQILKSIQDRQSPDRVRKLVSQLSDKLNKCYYLHDQFMMADDKPAATAWLHTLTNEFVDTHWLANMYIESRVPPGLRGESEQARSKIQDRVRVATRRFTDRERPRLEFNRDVKEDVTHEDAISYHRTCYAAPVSDPPPTNPSRLVNCVAMCVAASLGAIPKPGNLFYHRCSMQVPP